MQRFYLRDYNDDLVYTNTADWDTVVYLTNSKNELVMLDDITYPAKIYEHIEGYNYLIIGHQTYTLHPGKDVCKWDFQNLILPTRFGRRLLQKYTIMRTYIIKDIVHIIFALMVDLQFYKQNKP